VKLLVTGAGGLLGKNLIPELIAEGHEVRAVESKEVDLRNFKLTSNLICNTKPDGIIHLAARVGGIGANIEGGYRFFRENVEIDQSVFRAAIENEVLSLVYMGSSCMYPCNLDKPMKEDQLWNGPLEKTNEPYALAKLMATKYVESVSIEEGLSWRTFIASNLYGPHDHFGSNRSHMVAAVIERISKAKELGLDSIEMWGDGKPRREFTYVGDVTQFISSNISHLEKLPNFMNLGFGTDYEVITYYQEISSILEYQGVIVPNLDKPNGTMRKIMDSSLAHAFGWSPKIGLREGLQLTINSFQQAKG
jgi:GDP-L-fucose synthase